MVDARADEVDVSVNGRDFTIKQSPGVLQSKREGGSTGAALWRLCVLVAEWLAWEQNPLFKYGALNATTTVMELGSGISGLITLTLAPLVRRVVATDQQYALKLLQENVTNNPPPQRSSQKREKTDIDVLPLDWEADDIPSFLRSNDMKDGVDAVLVCDCVETVQEEGDPRKPSSALALFFSAVQRPSIYSLASLSLYSSPLADQRPCLDTSLPSPGRL